MHRPPARSILHVIAPAPFGGLESVVQTLAVEQLRAGHAVQVAAFVWGDDLPASVHTLRRAGVTVHALKAGGRAYARRVNLLSQVISSVRPDVVHSHGYVADILAPLANRGGGAGHVSTVHGFTGGDRKNRLYEWLMIQAYRWYDAVVAVSHPLHDDLVRRGVEVDRIHTVPNAFVARDACASREEARKVLRLESGDFVAGWVGRLSAEKGPDVLVDAVAKTVSVNVVVIGDGPLRADLVARAESLGISSRLRFAGAVPDAGRLLRAFDAVVLSSRTEGTPMVLLEALAAEVPIVATAVGGIPHVVSSAEALLVASENPVALAAAIEEVEMQPAAARARATCAKARFDAEFGGAGWVDAYDAVYSAAIDRHRVGA